MGCICVFRSLSVFPMGSIWGLCKKTVEDTGSAQREGAFVFFFVKIMQYCALGAWTAIRRGVLGCEDYDGNGDDGDDENDHDRGCGIEGTTT